MTARLGVELTAWPTLGFNPALPYYETDNNGRFVGLFPALVASVRDVNNRLVGAHRTYLARDGSGKAPVKSPKKLMSLCRGKMAGCAIRLFEATETLILAEGIETALALSCVLDLPAWATICAYGLETVALPKAIRTVFVVGDNDVSGRGQEACLKCRKKLESEGRSVHVIFPPRQGMDRADVLKEDAK